MILHHLQSLLCNNKDELIPNSYPGVSDLNIPVGKYRWWIKKENHQ